MPIDQSELQAAANSTTARKSIVEARKENKVTAFLCHSHNDAAMAKGLQSYLQKMGWEIYIDWEDSSLPDRPNRVTAKKIQAKIRELDMFLFLATQNSMASRWCPWEIGYADGVKTLNRILILPTRDSRGVTHGNEYLELYRHIGKAKGGGIGHFDASGSGYQVTGSWLPS